MNAEQRRAYHNASAKKSAAANREKVRERNRKWRADNPAKVSAQNRRFYVAKGDIAKAERREWRLANAEKMAAYKAAWNAAHPEARRAKRREWAALNKDKINAKTAERHAKKVSATPPSWANRFYIREAFALAKLRERICGGQWHVDHIVPLRARLVSGLHWETNLRVISAAVNVRKHNSYWPDMPDRGQ